MKYILVFTTYFLIFNNFILADQLNLTKKEKDWIKQHSVVKVSNQSDWAPCDYNRNGVARGYSVDLIKKLAEKSGIKVKFINAPSWSELLEKFNNNKIDLMHTMAWNKSRDNKYLFSAPYMPYKNSYIIRTDENSIHSSEDLDGKTIATGKDWDIVKTLKKKYPNATIIELPNSLSMLEALSMNKVDAIVDNINTIKFLMSENIITNVKHGGYIEDQAYKKKYLYFVAHKTSPELISILNKAYDNLTTTEKLDIQKKWFSKTNTKELVFTKEQHQYLKNKKVIKMCIDPNWMPYEKFDQNGKHIGMTAEYFKLFESKIGIPIKVVPSSTWTESIQIAKTRGCDIYSLAMETPERKEYMNFTSPYLSIPLVLATNMHVPFINDMRNIEDQRIGIVKGYAFNEIIRQKYKNIKVVDVKNINDGLQKVINGELYGFIGTLASVGYAFQKNFMGELKITGKFDEKWELGIGTRNDEPILQNIFEKSIQSISSRKHQDILNRYIAIKYEKGTDYSLIIKILVIATILAAIGIYAYRRLSLANKELKALQDKLVEQANRDPLTNLYNRRYLYDVASNLLTISKREKTDIGIIMLDIDNFKQINDTHGHAVGDEVIKSLSNILTTHTRESDIIARFGGEEFIVLLPHTDSKGATNIASKLRAIVENEIVTIDKNLKIKFTISLGVDNVLKDDKNIDSALNRADKALYKAKENGKNQLCIFKEGLSI
ncbi:diguanylate cyclase [Sulfurimonas sp.]|uniref:transporter substrate-binding domain-containing diguanylate cyclase n=1 Tax=Sulfurimonas sp. TaxID=2022749 RepID=UPI00356502A6